MCQLAQISFTVIMHPLTSVLIASLVLAVQGSPTTVIVGGRDAQEGIYPYQVSLREFNSHLCGGSIINKRYILTAAHCIVNKGTQDLLVVVGTIYLNKAGYAYGVEKTIPHENYTISDVVNDIGLVLVTNDIRFRSTVQPIPVTSLRVSEGTNAVITGWGLSSAWGSGLPNILQEIELTVISQETCSKMMGVKKPDTWICTYTKSGQGVCNGDSGGPLVVNGVQIGIVSHGIPCAVGFPDIYTSVYAYQEWISYNLETYVTWSNHSSSRTASSRTASSRTASFFVISTVMIALRCIL